MPEQSLIILGGERTYALSLSVEQVARRVVSMCSSSDPLSFFHLFISFSASVW